MRTNPKLLFALLVSVLIATVTVAGCAMNSSPSSSPTPSSIATIPQTVQQSPNANLTMSIIDVGQGDAILLRFPHNESLLVDGGKEGEGPTVIAYLNSIGVTHLNGVIATHPDSDHIGGLLTVLSSMPVDHVYDAGIAKTSATYATFLRIITQKNLSYTHPKAGDSISIDPDTSVFVMNPAQSTSAAQVSDNDQSIVIKVTYQRISYLLTGDAESSAEARMISMYNCSAYVLKVGHHGSSYSSSTAFLNAVMPRFAVISVGANNTYGHPASQTLARLYAVNATVYRTDHQGSIIVTTNGLTVDVQTARNT